MFHTINLSKPQWAKNTVGKGRNAGTGISIYHNFFQEFIRLSLSQTTNFRLFQTETKLKGFADSNFKLDENHRKFSKGIENTVGKGEIARYEQFLLSHSFFKSLLLQTRKNQGLFGKGILL